MITKSPFSEGTKLAILHVSLDLRVPNLGVEACEPISKPLQFFGAEALHLTFNVFDTVHTKLHVQLYQAATGGLSLAVAMKNSQAVLPTRGAKALESRPKGRVDVETSLVLI